MHSRVRILSFGVWILASSAFAQGPGGYNPIGPGVDLAGNWGPVTHEDQHERGPGPELANYAKMKPGYLRKNGVPYSADAVVTEYFDRVNEPTGDSWLIVKTIVADPQYLAQPFITSTHFKKQADASGWNPTPCSGR